MSRHEVHQFLPSLGFRDAVGNHTLTSQAVLDRAGIGGGVWAEDVHPEHRSRAKSYAGYERQRSARKGGNAILYQHSTGSRGMVEFVLERREPLAVYYHNITPAEFFEPFDAGAAASLARGREELKLVAGRARTAMANSAYSAAELRELSDVDVAVVPPYLPPGLDARPDASLTRWLRRTKRGTDVLFVGRVVPNKGHLHLLRTFAALRDTIDPGARLFVVGVWGPEAYMHRVFALRDRLGTDGVVFTGSISEPQLAAYYAESDVFVCCSQHEGFGLPLIEAMRAGLPVVAYDAGAVAETLGDAGICSRTLEAPVLAELTARAAAEPLRSQLVARQHERVREIESQPRDQLLLSAVGPLLRA